MKYQDLFEAFNTEGQLRLPCTAVSFNEIPWNKHPSFDGVESKKPRGSSAIIWCGLLLVRLSAIMSIKPNWKPMRSLLEPVLA